MNASDPLSSVPHDARPAQSQPAGAGPLPPAGSPRRILLVEDNPINREVAGEILLGGGYAVEAVIDGQQALDRLARSDRFDLVLMDLQMPVLDGVEATRRIRLQPAFDRLPVVALTANATAQDRQRCREAGMNDFIAKPIDPELLLAKATEWTGWARAPAAPRAVPAANASRTGADDPGLLDGIEGLDVRNGLHYCLDRWSLYKQMLQQFVEQEGDAELRLGQAVAEQDWATAHHLAHTLKGVAGTLGAREIQALARDLDEAVRGRDGRRPDPDQARALFARLDAGLQALLAALRQALPAPPAAAHPPPASGGPGTSPAAPLPPVSERLTAPDAGLAEPARTLLRRLDQGDPAAAGWAGEHAPALAALLGNEHAALAEAIDAFDYERAADILRRHLHGESEA